MLIRDALLDNYASGRLGALGRLWVALNLALDEKCRIRLEEIKLDMETEAELKAALSELPDAGEPPQDLSRRMAACKAAPKR